MVIAPRIMLIIHRVLNKYNEGGKEVKKLFAQEFKVFPEMPLLIVAVAGWRHNVLLEIAS